LNQTIDVLFIVPSHDKNRVSQVMNLVEEAVIGGVKHIILVSLLGAESRAMVFASQFKDMEDGILKSGISYTFLRCSPFQQNFLALASSFQQSVPTIKLPIGTGSFAPIHVADVASVAATIILDSVSFLKDSSSSSLSSVSSSSSSSSHFPLSSQESLNNNHSNNNNNTSSNNNPHSGKIYRLTGPELVSGVEIAGKASRGLGRPVKFRDLKLGQSQEWWGQCTEMTTSYPNNLSTSSYSSSSSPSSSSSTSSSSFNSISSQQHVNHIGVAGEGREQWLSEGYIEMYSLVKKNFYSFVTPDVGLLSCFEGIRLEEFFHENATFLLGGGNTNVSTSSNNNNNSNNKNGIEGKNRSIMKSGISSIQTTTSSSKL